MNSHDLKNKSKVPVHESVIIEGKHVVLLCLEQHKRRSLTLPIIIHYKYIFFGIPEGGSRLPFKKDRVLVENFKKIPL